MWRQLIIFLILCFCINDFAYAQQVPAKTDSTKLYQNIESFSKRRKLTKFMYRLIFRPVEIIAPKKKIKKKVYTKLIKKPYSAYEGKIIRNIDITTLDPFGFSIADTIQRPPNFLTKSGNALHIKSQRIGIRNLLLIRQNQKFDSLLVKESERLVRSQSYVHDVSFVVMDVSKNSDSVDIFIRELDNWSITPRVAVSNSRVTLILTDKNFLGIGHEFQNGFTWYHTNGEDAYYTRYHVPNIKNTYINSTLFYGTDEYRNFTKSFSVDRPFYSPLTRWAAGVSFTQQFRNDSLYTLDSLYVPQSFKFNDQDFWAGNAIHLFKGNSENDRTTNFIYAGRFLRTRYLQRPVDTLDLLRIYSNNNFYLANIGVSTRKYVHDKYVLKFGLTEDVPVGKVYALTGGYFEKQNSGNIYLGARVSFGDYYWWGYLSSNFEYGTFLRSHQTQQEIFSASLNYFTTLLVIGKWKFRQFIKPQVLIGVNRLAYDSLTLNDGYGIDGFNSNGLTGTKRILLKFQTQSYPPWNFIGFNFGPYFICSLGLLGDSPSGFKNSRLYSQIGLGVLIKNDYLIINTFQFSISYYPNIPGNGQNIFKVNSFRTTDFGFNNFELGKPGAVVFQ